MLSYFRWRRGRYRRFRGLPLRASPPPFPSYPHRRPMSCNRLPLPLRPLGHLPRWLRHERPRSEDRYGGSRRLTKRSPSLRTPRLLLSERDDNAGGTGTVRGGESARDGQEGRYHIWRALCRQSLWRIDLEGTSAGCERIGAVCRAGLAAEGVGYQSLGT